MCLNNNNNNDNNNNNKKYINILQKLRFENPDFEIIAIYFNFGPFKFEIFFIRRVLTCLPPT